MSSRLSTPESSPLTEAPVHWQSVLQPVDQAHGLPNAHYVDNTMFELENRRVLMGNWSGVGFGKDVPEPGDVRPFEFLGMPLLLARDLDGAINVFQNTCRHRGMILLDEPARIRQVIRCPYHSWCYDLKGELKATPHVGGAGCNTHEGIDNSELGLFRVRSAVWRDVVFINLSGDAPEFCDYAAPLIERWKEFDQPMFHGGERSSITFEVKTNWKLAVENYCESYHLPWIHPGLNTYSRLQDHYHIEQPGVFSGQGTRVYRQLRNSAEQTMADFGELSEQWNEGAEYIALYPNVLLGVHRDHAFAIVLEPKSQGETIEHIELYYAEPVDAAAADSDVAALHENNARQWHAVFEEDLFVVEGMQRGRRGPLFDGGKFSPAMDGPTHLFHRWVASQMMVDTSPTAGASVGG